MGLRERHKERTRRLLIDAAHRLARQHGYRDVTIQMIAETAEVSPRTVFRYFRNKPALVLASIADVFEDFLDRVERHCAHGASMAGLFAALTEHFHTLGDYDLLEPHMDWIRTDPELAAELARIQYRTGRKVAERLAQMGGEAEPTIRHTTLAAVAMAVGSAALDQWYVTDRSQPPVRFLEAAIRSGPWMSSAGRP